nr:hypothetical protein [Streptomyces sp. MJM1172]
MTGQLSGWSAGHRSVPQHGSGASEPVDPLLHGVVLGGDEGVAFGRVGGGHHGGGVGEGHQAVVMPRLGIGEPFQGGAVVLAHPTTPRDGLEQPAFLVVAQRRHGHPEGAGDLADRHPPPERVRCSSSASC